MSLTSPTTSCEVCGQPGLPRVRTLQCWPENGYQKRIECERHVFCAEHDREMPEITLEEQLEKVGGSSIKADEFAVLPANSVLAMSAEDMADFIRQYDVVVLARRVNGPWIAVDGIRLLEKQGEDQSR